MTFDLPPPAGSVRSRDTSPGAGQETAGLEFADYVLLEEIGRGGMGVVYRARQRSLNRIVALKMILSGRFASPDSVQRFRAEAQAAAALQHPNIVAIHEVGDREGHHYFSMDHVEGCDLGTLARSNPLPSERSARYMKTVAEAIHYAHERGIVHRDLKPSNILIDAFDQPRITDFGLAKRLETAETATRSDQPRGADATFKTRNAELTVTGQVLGSPGFLPPEQATGKPGETGPASDIYSIGAILYYLLTGRPPFQAETLAETIDRVMRTEPVSPRLFNPACPKDLETICLKCLEKESARRYLTARKLADDLDRFLSGEPIQARPVGRGERWWRWCRRNPKVAALAAVAGVLFAGGLLGVLGQWQRAEGLARRESMERGRAEHALGQLELQRAEDLLGSNQAAEGLAYLARVLRQSPTNDTAALRILSVLSHRSFPLPATPPMQHAGPVFSVEFSPDGTRVVTASQDNTARIWDARTGRSTAPPLQHADEVNAAQFSADGQKVVTASDDHSARVWNAWTGEPLTPALRHEDRVVSARFSPDGSRVVTASEDRTARIWAATDGAPIGEPIAHGDTLVDASFAPDGKHILSASERDGLVLVSDAATGALRRRLFAGGPVHSARFSPEGTRIVVASGSGFARVWDWVSGYVITTLAHRDVVLDAVFSPDGELLATVSWDRRALLWDARTGELVAELPGHRTWVESAEFTRDGLRLLTRETSNRAFIWDVLTGQRLEQPLQVSSLLYDARFSPDGRQVAVATIDGAAQIWTVAPGMSLPLTLIHSNNLLCAGISRDGRRVVTGCSDGWLTVWNAETGRSERAFKHDGGVVSVQFSPDGRRILSVSTDETASVWFLDGSERVTVREPAVRLARFNPDGKAFLTATSHGVVRTWRTENGERLAREPMHHGSTIWHAEFSPDGRIIATASGNYTARLWDARTGQPCSPTLEHRRGIRYVSFDPDGTRVVTASRDHSAAIWSVPAGERLAELWHKGQLRCARFSPDGRRVVTASFDNTARVWDASTGAPLVDPLRHAGEVQYAEFSQDGRWVVTASLDGTARVWDSRSGKPATEPLDHLGGVSLARFSADGRRLFTASRLARIWELPSVTFPAPEWLADLAEGVAGQRLDQRGSLQPRDSRILQQIREDLDSAVAPDDYVQWGQWFFSDRQARRISPLFSLEAGEAARRFAEQNSLEGVAQAIRLSPTNGAAYARLARLILQQQSYEDPLKLVRAELWSRRGLVLSPENLETWLAHAETLVQRRKREAVVATLDSATVRHPDDPGLWHRKGQLLSDQGLWVEALHAFNRAKAHSGKLSDAQRIRLLADSERALARLNRTGAPTPSPPARMPGRDPKVPEACLDLSMFYNAALTDDWHGRAWPGNNLATLPGGYQRLKDAAFDIRGIVQLAGRAIDYTAPGFPQQVASIPVGRPCKRLYFLHAAGWANAVPAGTQIGGYIVHYAEGSLEDIPLRNGEELAEWHIGAQGAEDLKRAAVAWTGTNARNIPTQLFVYAWENPRPKIPIASLDFVSAMTHAAPFVVAITAEP